MQSGIVSAVEWRKKNDRWVCNLLCYAEGCTQLWLDSGRYLSFKVQRERYCIDYTSTSSHNSSTCVTFKPWKILESCPLKTQLRKGYQCSSCSGAEVMHPCLICDGTKCLAEYDRQRICHAATAYVYLASFSPNQVKVGVAHQSRIPQRWIEQGANLAKRIMIGNGMEVRQFETAIQTSLNVLSRLRTRMKIDTLWKTQTHHETIALAKVEATIMERFHEYPSYRESLHDLSQIYDLPDLERRPIELQVKNDQQITGEILGVKGSLILLNVNDLPHFFDLKHLLGRKITFNDANEVISQRILDEF